MITCPIKNVLCVSPKCFVEEGKIIKIKMISCEKANNDTIYYQDDKGKVMKVFSTREKK